MGRSTLPLSAAGTPLKGNDGDTLRFDGSTQEWYTTPGGGGGSITPVHNALLVSAQSTATEPDGSWSGDKAYLQLQDAIDAAVEATEEVAAGACVVVTRGTYAGATIPAVQPDNEQVYNISITGIAYRDSIDLGSLDWDGDFGTFYLDNVGGAFANGTAVDIVMNNCSFTGSEFSEPQMRLFMTNNSSYSGNCGAVIGKDSRLANVSCNYVDLVNCHIATNLQLLDTSTPSKFSGCTFEPGGGIIDTGSGPPAPITYMDQSSYANAILNGWTVQGNVQILDMTPRNSYLGSSAVIENGDPPVELVTIDALFQNCLGQAGFYLRGETELDTPGGTARLTTDEGGSEAELVIPPLTAGEVRYVPLSHIGSGVGLDWTLTLEIDSGLGNAIATDIFVMVTCNNPP